MTKLNRYSNLFKYSIASEKLKLELWSVLFGVMIIDILTFYAGSLFWLLIAGLIFGSMSRRGNKDALYCGLPSALGTAIALLFFGLKAEAVRTFPLPLTSESALFSYLLLILISFIFCGLTGLVGSRAIIYYVRKKYGANGAAQ
ncbi:MAG: hypothetical protein QXP70_05090 [Methanomassiliicoccales archaeon]